jgi:hypothetical protein
MDLRIPRSASTGAEVVNLVEALREQPLPKGFAYPDILGRNTPHNTSGEEWLHRDPMHLPDAKNRIFRKGNRLLGRGPQLVFLRLRTPDGYAGRTISARGPEATAAAFNELVRDAQTRGDKVGAEGIPVMEGADPSNIVSDEDVKGAWRDLTPGQQEGAQAAIDERVADSTPITKRDVFDILMDYAHVP